MRREPGQERQKRRAFHQAGAERVGDRNLPSASRFNEARDAEQRLTAQGERIAVSVVHAAQNHVHRAQAIEGLEEDSTVAHGKVTALDQREAQQPRHIGVLEVGFVPRTGRQQRDGGIVRSRWREPAQRFAVNRQALRKRTRTHRV
jgi:hypothetical protein